MPDSRPANQPELAPRFEHIRESRRCLKRYAIVFK